jgi:hypothetical protein
VNITYVSYQKFFHWYACACHRVLIEFNGMFRLHISSFYYISIIVSMHCTTCYFALTNSTNCNKIFYYAACVNVHVCIFPCFHRTETIYDVLYCNAFVQFMLTKKKTINKTADLNIFICHVL